MIKRQTLKDGSVKVSFVLPNDPVQPRISVVGDFNDWDPDATPLMKRNNDTRSANVTLESGKRYQFRYYSQDGTWFNDPEADAYQATEHGSQNCVVIC